MRGHVRHACVLALCTLAGCGADEKKPTPAKNGETVVKLCDNKTTTTVPAGPATPEQGQKISDALMARWKAEHPGVDWEAEERKSRTFVPAYDNKELLAADTQAPGTPYRNFTEEDLLTWERETEKLVVAGSKVFHSSDELGSMIAVSCDMCHPNAANTHPETYPKYQTQRGRVALLRDMINWCLENPCRAQAMDADDPRMRALEAYIVSQRAGTPLAYGKH
jgi:cytochrome c553